MDFGLKNKATRCVPNRVFWIEIVCKILILVAKVMFHLVSYAQDRHHVSPPKLYDILATIYNMC